MSKRDDWELEHSPYTVEGQIEGLGRFASGARRARGRRRLAATVIVLVPLAAAVLGIVFSLVR